MAKNTPRMQIAHMNTALALIETNDTIEMTYQTYRLFGAYVYFIFPKKLMN